MERDWQAEAARLEAIVLDQQARLKRLEVRLDTHHRELLERGQVNARLNQENARLARQLKRELPA